VINIGDTVKVQIVRINRDTQRISLGMKQLESDPWEGAIAKYPVGASCRAPSPTSPNMVPSSNWKPASKAWSTFRKCPGPRRTSTPARSFRPARKSMSRSRSRSGQAPHQPWPQAGPAEPLGSFRRKAPGWLDRRRRSQECDRIRPVHRPRWRRRRHGPHVGYRLGHFGRRRAGLHRKGEQVKAIVLDVDVEKERISLGMKQLEKGAPAAGAAVSSSGLKKNEPSP
jgi:small subunit ribosomal protein S1